MSGTSSIGKPLHDEIARIARSWFGREVVHEAPSKLNLRLKVEGRRDDGYHLLSMVNCSTSLKDTLRVEIVQSEQVVVTVTPADFIPPGGENLISKAWRAFWREFGVSNVPFGLKCELFKRIPVGGGLGGGSADAGAVLRHLQAIFGEPLARALGLSGEELRKGVLRAALSCGADIPYAVVGGLCWVGGIGDEVVPIKGSRVPPTKALIVVPPKPVPTAAFYDLYRRKWPIIKESPDVVGRQLLESGLDLASIVENDFETTAAEMVGEIAWALREMRGVFPRGTALTGSGSVCFSLIPAGGEDAMSKLSTRLNAQGFTTYLGDLIFS